MKALPWLRTHLVAIGAAALVVGMVMYGCEQRRRGADGQREKDLKAHVAARELVIDVLVKTKAKVDTVAGKAEVKYRAATVDYQHIADSIAATMKAQGKPLPPVVLACNAALAAADTALAGCARQVAVRDTLLAQADTVRWAQDSIIDVLEDRKPGRFGCAGPGTLSTKGASLGVSCGLVITF